MAIDRRAVVERHDVIMTAPDAQCPLTVGNGDFGCTVDITGMQTFTGFHDPSRAPSGRLVTNACTQTTWGWHAMPNPKGYTLADAMSVYPTSRGDVEYPDKFDMRAMMGGETAPDMAAGSWLVANPHRLDLGRVGLILRSSPDGEPERDPAVLSNVHQRLNLWSGTIHTSFLYAGETVSVTTAAHPERAEVAFRIESALLVTGLLEVGLAFPYASDHFMRTVEWDAGDRHSTVVEEREAGARIVRTLDATTYTVGLSWDAAALHTTDDPHRLRLRTQNARLELVVTYAAGHDTPESGSVDQTLAAAEQWWESFWQDGAAIDFSRCTDPRASELERRVVLSQYLTAVNCSGRTPPQETGLVANSWQGKFHLEMHWWHAAHFVPWGRPELLARSMGWYRTIMPVAQDTARQQGYDGARWPKQVGPDGRDSPSEIGPFLIWQQPHPIYYAELLYRQDPRPGVVDQLAEMVEETARFMASFVEERDGTYHLAPPLIPAQEFYDMRTTEDPTFELAYWWWALEIAQKWRERQGLARDATWTDVQERMAHPHQRDGAYTAIATEPYLKRDDHPSLLAALGVVPATPLVDLVVMRATLADVLASWDWDSAWGWDFPVLAMTAARLGDPGGAVDALLMAKAKNTYLVNGHNPQMGNFLPIYLPGNGGLLAAISLMVAGWEGATRPAPGFPDDGTWAIEHEGFRPWP
ncbi:MAG: hypothetical protein ABWZ76_00770 [Acidimicrobiales bacterium]